MKVIESSGASREEAIQSGLKELGVDLHEVERIDVIDEGSKGFLGMGKRPVRVRLSVEQAPSRDTQEQDRRQGDRSRRPSRQQNQPRRDDNKREARSENRDRGSNRDSNRDRDRDRDKGGAKDKAPRGNRTKSEPKDAPSAQDKRGGNRQDRGRNRNRQRNEPAGRQSEGQKPRPNHKASPITGKRAATVSEEATEAQNLADQFDNIDPNNDMAAAAPPNAREDDVFEAITDEQGKEAAALLNEVISHMELTAEATFVRTDDGGARLSVESEDDGGILIGKRGVTLEALQYLINRMMPQNDGNENTERVVVDVGGYVDRRHAMLRDMAMNMAARAKESRRNVRLKPLSPQERRIVHLTLEKDPDVRTYSTGEALFRSIVINPAGAKRVGNNRRGPKASSQENDTEMDPAQFGD